MGDTGKNMRFSEKKICIYKNIVVLICALGIFFYSIKNIEQLSIPYIIDDEFGYWSVGAWLAGYDWSGVTQWCGYYSYGYGFVLAIFIKAFNNMEIAYKCAICFNVALLLAIFFIVKTLVRKYYDGISFEAGIAISLLLTLVPVNLYHVNIAWPEVFLEFLLWLVFFWLTLYNEKKKAVYLYLGSIVLLYSYMVHNRTLVMIIAFIFFLLISQSIRRTDKAIIVVGIFMGLAASQCLKIFFVKIYG